MNTLKLMTPVRFRPQYEEKFFVLPVHEALLVVGYHVLNRLSFEVRDADEQQVLLHYNSETNVIKGEGEFNEAAAAHTKLLDQILRQTLLAEKSV